MFIIKVFILEDGMGEWWETLKKDGSTNRFIPGTATFARDKEFKSATLAINHAKQIPNKCKVIEMTPPIPPSRTWNEKLVWSS